MKDKEIKLESRYVEDKNYLTRLGDESSTEYLLHSEYSLRAGIVEGDPHTYTFVDPSGGPFITKGTRIGDFIVKSITGEERGIIIEFE